MNVLTWIIMGVFIGFLTVLADKKHEQTRSLNIGLLSVFGSSIIGLFAHQISTSAEFQEKTLAFIIIVVLFLSLQKLLDDFIIKSETHKGGEIYGSKSQ